MVTNVPVNWVRCRLGEVVIARSERVHPANDPNAPYLGLEDIERDTRRLASQGIASDSRSTKSRFYAGDLLYGRLRPNLNKVYLAEFAGICSTDILVLVCSDVLLPRFAMEVISSERFVTYAIEHAKGVNLPRIDFKSLGAFEFDLPPVEEQRRILSVLETAQQALVPLLRSISFLRRTVSAMPQAVISRSLASIVGSLSSVQSRVVSEAGEVTLGKARSPENHLGSNMRPYLRVANVREARIDTGDVMKMHFSPVEFERYRLLSGDILLNEGQSIDLVGRAAMYVGDPPDVAFTNTIIRFRANDETNPRFALYLFRHYLHSGVFQSVAKVTTNLAHLGASRFSALPFPSVPLDAQEEIADELDLRLAILEGIGVSLGEVESDAIKLWHQLAQKALGAQLLEPDIHAPAPNIVRAKTLLENRREAQRIASKAARVRKGGKVGERLTMSLKSALAASRSGLTGQELFSRAGYPLEATTDQVEAFYLELRSLLMRGEVVPRRVTGVERFFLGKEVNREN